MNTSWRSELPQILLVAGMFIVAAIVWPFGPESFPVHWNIRGEVDRYGGKFEGLLLLPLIALAIYGLLRFLPLLDPGRANYSSFQSAYLVIRGSILLLMAVMYACMLLVAFGYHVDIATVIPILIGGLFVVLGNVMGKIRPNWFVGVRTPWTLSSRHSWNKTHRLAGWLFVLMGIAIGGCAFMRSIWMPMIAGAVVIVSIAWLFFYSYLTWRDDPERLTPAQISPSNDGTELQ